MVEVLTAGAQWTTVPPADRTQYTVTPIEQYYATTGFPEVYDLIGEDTIIFYPAPVAASVTLASGLKVRFKRTADTFTSAQVTTGTKAPGFATPWHDILSYMAAQMYCVVFKPERVAFLENEIQKRKKELVAHYALRQKDQRKVMTNKKISFL